MDENLLAPDLSSLSEAEKTRILSSIDHLQIRESLKTYNTLVERCFNDCVNSFYRKSLGKQEENCVRQCTEKFLKHSVRVAVRFAELNQDGSTR